MYTIRECFGSWVKKKQVLVYINCKWPRNRRFKLWRQFMYHTMARLIGIFRIAFRSFLVVIISNLFKNFKNIRKIAKLRFSSKDMYPHKKFQIDFSHWVRYLSFTQEGLSKRQQKYLFFFGNHFCTQSSNDIDKSFFKPSMNNSFLRRGKRINKC